MRVLVALGLGIGLAGAVVGTSAAQDGAPGVPRAGDTVLNCADGGWDVAGGTCQGRGGVIGSQLIGSGVGSSAVWSPVQPNAITGGASSSPSNVPPRRCGWANPCDSGTGDPAP